MEIVSQIQQQLTHRDEILSKYQKNTTKTYSIFTSSINSQDNTILTNKIKLLMVENDRLKGNISEILDLIKKENENLYPYLKKLKEKVLVIDVLKKKIDILKNEKIFFSENSKKIENSFEMRSKIVVEEYKEKIFILEKKLKNFEKNNFKYNTKSKLSSELEMMYKMKINNLLKKQKKILEEKTLLALENKNLNFRISNLRKKFEEIKKNGVDKKNENINEELIKIKNTLKNFKKDPNEKKKDLLPHLELLNDFQKKIMLKIDNNKNNDNNNKLLEENKILNEKLKNEIKKKNNFYEENKYKENELIKNRDELQMKISKIKIFMENEEKNKNLIFKYEKKIEKLENEIEKNKYLLKEKEYDIIKNLKEKKNFSENQNYEKIILNLKKEILISSTKEKKKFS